MQRQEQWIYHAKIDASGRLVIPAEARERHHINEGDTVVVVDDERGLHLKSLDQALAEAQDYFATLAPPERILSDEINADRRTEAERD
ncbi:MAG: AbrB/MazE/SpoVT family DNA-binding domain-containing protein [Pirellulales bacterium]|nr:AbrB/MazE/SpoVT family DNA-binding domain-containing protein [Pirellulales bacterium]